MVLSGWPRVSETFAANELLALQHAGMLAGVFATKAGDATLRQPQCDELGEVTILGNGDADAQGAELAGLLRDRDATAVHGYFAHLPAAVARSAADRLGVPFGFSVHALDARKVEPAVLHERAAAARCVIACNPDVAASLRAVGVEPTLTPHGVDRSRFSAAPELPELPELPEHGAAPELLAVGRLVDKKGFDVLLEAVAAMRSPWRLRIVGEGPNRAALDAAVAQLGLADRVSLHGRVTHGELPGLLHACRVVVVPSVTDAAGDRDGLPNVVLEAMASGRAVVASDVAAIAEAVHHERTGLMVAPNDAVGLAAALDRLAADPVLRRRLADAAQHHVRDHYDLTDCSERFCRLLEVAYG